MSLLLLIAGLAPLPLQDPALDPTHDPTHEHGLDSTPPTLVSAFADWAAIGFTLDLVADAVDADGPGPVPDGFDIQGRQFEIYAAAQVDSELWAYVSVVSEGLETLEVDEAAAEYSGFDGGSTVKAGKFFADFGRQMRRHLPELRTLDRPLVLREFLGAELRGTGAQWDLATRFHGSPVRVSVAAFGSLLGEPDEDPTLPTAQVSDRRDLDEFTFTARVSGEKDFGGAKLDVGASARVLPEFSFQFGPLATTGLSNVVYGVDAGLSLGEEPGRVVRLGGEALVLEGHLSAFVDDPAAPTTLTVIDDDVAGFYAYADAELGPRRSAGVQWSWIEDPSDPAVQASEVDVYFTHELAESRRLRFGVTVGDDVGGVEDVVRAYVQLTAFFGTHAHDHD